MSGRLSDKVCIVTGSGGSMGRATALTFAREGGLVVGCDVATESAEETPPNTVLGFAIIVGLGVAGAGALLARALRGAQSTTRTHSEGAT
jgi:NAD(P)-dependent dehydrogenase (short-subunit alcohol dehydrogenase family)